MMGSRLNDADIWNSRINIKSLNFTDEQLAELKECFILFDQTGSGFIEADDLSSALRALGQNPSDEDVALLLQDANLDAMGRLSAAEYLQVVSRYGLKQETEMNDELSEAFKVFDRNDVGSIDSNELRNALKTFGETLPDEDIEEIMKLAGVSDGSMIDYMEFVKKLISK